MKKKKQIAHRHDLLAKRALSDLKTARDLIRHNFSPGIVKALDLQSLQLTNGSFVDEKLKEKRSDVVLCAKMDGKPAFVSFIIEHQSEEDPLMPARLMAYNARLMEQYLRNNRYGPVPVILNKVLYSGSKPYQGAKSLAGAFSAPTLALEVMQEDFLIDLASKAPQQISKEGQAALLQLSLQIRQSSDFWRLLQANYLGLQVLITRSPYAGSVIVYMLEEGEADPRQMLEEIRNLNPEIQQKVMSTYDQLIQQGMQQGMQQGVQQGIQQGMQQGIQQGVQQAIHRLAQRQGISKAEASKLLQP